MASIALITRNTPFMEESLIPIIWFIAFLPLPWLPILPKLWKDYLPNIPLPLLWLPGSITAVATHFWDRKKSYRYALFCMTKIFIWKFRHFSLHTKNFHPKIFNQSCVISVQKVCTSGAIYFLSTEQKWFFEYFSPSKNGLKEPQPQN